MPASKVITSQRLKDVSAGFQTTFNKNFSENKTQWDKVATRSGSTSAKEIYGWLADTFGMKELVGEMIIEDIKANDYELKNLKFYDAKKVAKDDIEDDRLGTYGPMFAMMGRGANIAYDKIIFDRLTNGFTNLCWDGKPFFATNHPTGYKNNTFSNKGTKKFSADNLRDALIALQTVKNGNNDPWGFGNDPSSLVIVSHPKNKKAIEDVVLVSKGANGADNTLFKAALPLISPFVTNEDAWFVLETGWPLRPLILQEREKINVVSVNQPDDAWVVLNQAYLFAAIGRYNGGYGLPAMAWGSTGADAA